jgi:GNAT superfamily N-acetyltransferase
LLNRTFMLDIRPAAAADVDHLHALIGALAAYEKLTDICTGSREDLRAALFGERPAAEALIAWLDGEPAGFALFFPTFSTFLARRGLWLEDLFVRPELRGRGIGKALITAVAGVAHAQGCGRFEWAVLDWNTSAIRFYEGLGARLMPEWRLARVTGAALASMAGTGPAGPDRR